MLDFNPRREMRPQAFQFFGATNDGSSVCSRTRSPFSDSEEMELAFELLQVTSEAELDQFLGDLFKKAWRGIEPVRSNIIVPPLGDLLKTVAEKALPSVAIAAGTGDGISGKLGTLVSQALEAEVAGIVATDRDLEKCRQLFEKHRQFVRLAGKAATAAASAPTGVNPIAVAQKILADSAKEKLTQNGAPAGLAGTFSQGAPAAVRMKTATAAGRAAGQKRRTGRQAPGGRPCSICERPPGSCQCRKIGRSGRWFRSGSSIIVNC